MLSDRHSKPRTVFRVVSGNFLEMYDFFVFAYYATAIGHTFFPQDNEFASLMLSLTTFGVGFLVRPLGAIVLGAYLDEHGRRKGLLLTLSLMSIGTLSMAATPGYQTLGLFAPLLIVAGRLLQGFSAGVEVGGVSVYLSEMATPGHKGFYVAWQSASQQVAVIFIALLGVTLATYLTPQQLDVWGWRIPFIVGCMIIPFIYVIRNTLQETEAFLAQKHHPTAGDIFRSMVTHWWIVLFGLMLVLMTTVSFYFITAFTPDLRPRGAEADQHGQPDRDALRRLVEPVLAADGRRHLRPRRPQAHPLSMHGTDAGQRISDPPLASIGAVIRPAAAGRVVALVALRHL